MPKEKFEDKARNTDHTQTLTSVKPQAKSEMGGGHAPMRIMVSVRPQAKSEMGGGHAPIRI